MSSAASSAKVLSTELTKLTKEPVEGFSISLKSDHNMYEWKVVIFGPPKTLYEGGYFKAEMTFPKDYPYSPPTFRFRTEMWHPNIYENGDVCISILHPPVDDPQSGELPSERWNPTQNVRTVLLSVISLLNEPNTYSPANVDASVMYRKWKESGGAEDEYKTIIVAQVKKSQEDAKRDGVKIPTTLDEYCIKWAPEKETVEEIESENFWYDDDDDDDDMDSEDYEDD